MVCYSMGGILTDVLGRSAWTYRGKRLPFARFQPVAVDYAARVVETTPGYLAELRDRARAFFRVTRRAFGRITGASRLPSETTRAGVLGAGGLDIKVKTRFSTIGRTNARCCSRARSPFSSLSAMSAV